ncbi:MAG: hypothetical protein JNL70_06175 [Saprospiraceae bacterium]|nr:hypothetical protein [Saprospiraceae bacterium]
MKKIMLCFLVAFLATSGLSAQTPTSCAKIRADIASLQTVIKNLQKALPSLRGVERTATLKEIELDKAELAALQKKLVALKC